MKKNLITAEVMEDVISELRTYISNHKDNAHIMSVLNEHLDYLIESKYAYYPSLAKQLVDSKIHLDEDFRKTIGLGQEIGKN